MNKSKLIWLREYPAQVYTAQIWESWIFLSPITSKSKVISNSPGIPPEALKGISLIKILRMCPNWHE